MIKTFLSYLKHERRYSSHTVAAYSRDLALFQTYLNQDGAEVAIGEASYQDIRGWIYQLVSAKNDPNSVNRRISSLRSYYKFLYKNGEIDEIPTAKVENLRTKKRLPDVLNEKELAHLFEQLEEQIDRSQFRSMRDYLILLFFYSTGIRRQELIDLDTADIDLGQQRVKVTGKGNKQRQIPINDKMIFEIRNYMGLKEQIGEQMESTPFFVSEKGQRMSPKSIYNIINMQLGLVTTKSKRSPHVLRHSFATHLLNSGADIQIIRELLGHSSLAATQVYTHNSIEKLKKAYKLAHPRS